MRGSREVPACQSAQTEARTANTQSCTVTSAGQGGQMCRYTLPFRKSSWVTKAGSKLWQDEVWDFPLEYHTPPLSAAHVQTCIHPRTHTLCLSLPWVSSPFRSLRSFLPFFLPFLSFFRSSPSFLLPSDMTVLKKSVNPLRGGDLGQHWEPAIVLKGERVAGALKTELIWALLLYIHSVPSRRETPTCDREYRQEKTAERESRKGRESPSKGKEKEKGRDRRRRRE